MNHGKPHSLRGRDGFSLIEILVVLVLITLITSFAAPSMSAYVDRTKTRRALDRLVGDIAYSRLIAVEQGRRTAIVIQDDGSYTIQALDESGTWVTLKTVALRNEFPGVSVGGGLMNIEFTSRGMLNGTSANDGFIKVSRASVRDSVFVSPAGRVYRAY